MHSNGNVGTADHAATLVAAFLFTENLPIDQAIRNLGKRHDLWVRR